MARRGNAVKQAVQVAGGVKRVAILCDVHTQTVYNWIIAGRVDRLRHALLLADAAKMNVRDLATEDAVGKL